MNTYQQLIDELITLGTSVEQALPVIIEHRSSTGMAHAEYENNSNQALIVRSAFLQALQMPHSLRTLEDLRVDLQVAQ